VKRKVNSEANEKLDSAYKQYYKTLYHFCCLKLKNEEQTEDCVQESFCVLYEHLLKGEEIKNVGGFLYKIANNLVKVQWRKNQKEQNILQWDSMAEILISEQIIIQQNVDYDELAKKLISTLDEKEIELYKKKYIEAKSIKEISEELEISSPAVAKRLSRLRKKIKDLISIEFEGGE